MPRFFFDVLDGDDLTRDGDGHELSDWQQARAYAASLVLEIAGFCLGGDDGQKLAVKVRDVAGRMGYSATLSFAAERYDDPPIAEAQ